MGGGLRTKFVPLNNNSLGYALYCNGVIISGTKHIWHVSHPFLDNTVTAQEEENLKIQADACKKFEHRISEWTYLNKGHRYAHDVAINNIYYVYHNPVATKGEQST